MTQQQALAVMKLGHNVFLNGEPDASNTPSKGNVPDDWQKVTNAADQNPEYR